jgi:hypothetical protein
MIAGPFGCSYEIGLKILPKGVNVKLNEFGVIVI